MSAKGHADSLEQSEEMCPMTKLNWSQYQGDDFRETAGKELWGEKFKDVLEGGQDENKLDVVIWVAVPEQLINSASKLPDRPMIRIIQPSLLLQHDDDNRYLDKKMIKKVYILKRDAEPGILELDEETLKKFMPENVSRFTSEEMRTALDPALLDE